MLKKCKSSPFSGDISPTRIPLFAFGSDRASLPFPHPWNYKQPIKILESYFWKSKNEIDSDKHNRYLKIIGFPPVFVTRDPQVIQSIAMNTGDKEGQFDRDTLPSEGIARATGKDSLLYSNGAVWKRQKKLSSSPFRKSTLFQPEQFQEFSETFRITVAKRLQAFENRQKITGSVVQVPLELEIKAVMLELLTNCFFGTDISNDDIWDRYVPALECVIDHIVSDTVINKVGISIFKVPSFTSKISKVKASYKIFEELTDLVLATRQEENGLWKQFKSDVSNDAIRSNIKVFIAGALEATTSYASWVISHLARNPFQQEQVYNEVKSIDDYTPENLKNASKLGNVLNETLRLTPSLYFLPRKATVDTTIKTNDGRKMVIPKGTHILLDVWHANRHEDNWGVAKTGYPANIFEPERWDVIKTKYKEGEEPLHFGFGYGPRVCPGKNLGQMEVALVVGAFVKLFKFKAVNTENLETAGVSTKPKDGVFVQLELR